MKSSIFDSSEFNQNLFFPRLDHSQVPEKAEDIFIKVDKSCSLRVRLHKSTLARFSLLFFHGNGEIISDYDNLSIYFRKLGCELIICDYRGYGKSEGVPTLRNALKDSFIIYKYLKFNRKLKTNVCVMGRSLGSACAIDLCIKLNNIGCCVIESGYADPIPLVERRGISINNISNEDIKLFNNSEKIRLLKCPLLILHGEKDFIISREEAELNYQNAGSANKKLEILKRVGHNDMIAADNNAYFENLNKFFDIIF